MTSWKSGLPWWAKIPAKVALGCLPIPYGVWKRLGLFDHGAMDDGEYALGVFRRHFEKAGRPSSFSCLELGPGDSVATALIAKAMGGNRTWLVDSGAYASVSPGLYRQIYSRLHLDKQVELAEFSTFDQLMGVTNGTYLTEGLASLRTIPSASVDFAFSQAALEHVRLAELDDLLCELRRVLRPGARTTHQIDLKDHIAESLHSLRFSGKTWESGLIARAGLYTNRVRCSEMKARFMRAGFELLEIEERRWLKLPISRRTLVEPYRSLPEQELLVNGMFIVARPV